MILTPDDRTFVKLRNRVAKRALEIEIGEFESFAIGSALEGQRWERPMTHDLLGQVISSLRATVRRVLITEHREGVYFAEMELTDRDGSTVTVSARPSDAIAVALGSTRRSSSARHSSSTPRKPRLPTRRRPDAAYVPAEG